MITTSSPSTAAGHVNATSTAHRFSTASLQSLLYAVKRAIRSIALWHLLNTRQHRNVVMYTASASCTQATSLHRLSSTSLKTYVQWLASTMKILHGVLNQVKALLHQKLSWCIHLKDLAR